MQVPLSILNKLAENFGLTVEVVCIWLAVLLVVLVGRVVWRVLHCLRRRLALRAQLALLLLTGAPGSARPTGVLTTQ